MTGGDAGQLAYGQHWDEQRREANSDGGCDREIGVRASEGLTNRSNADGEVGPVLAGVERPVERGEEAEVQELDNDEHAERGPEHPGHETPRTGRQDEREADDDEPLEREPHEGARGEKPRPDRSDEG